MFQFLERLLRLAQIGFKEVLIDVDRAVLALQVVEGRQLEHVVEGDPMQDEAGERVNEFEAAVNHPVRQPPGLLFGVVLVEHNKRLESGVSNGEQTGDVVGAEAKDNETG